MAAGMPCCSAHDNAPTPRVDDIDLQVTAGPRRGCNGGSSGSQETPSTPRTIAKRLRRVRPSPGAPVRVEVCVDTDEGR